MDFGRSMLERARRAVEDTGRANVQITRAEAENLPLPEASIDVGMVNGLFNLNPLRTSIFRELSRVIRPGGAVYAAELILKAPLPAEERKSEDNWFA
jgi:ubiquinone/menaquinone biosynthesis C-methylase UbiE